MYGYIYLTTNLINGKKYIGQHKYDKLEIDESYLGSGILISKAILKYGKDNFKCEILEYCLSRESLIEREVYYINKSKADLDDLYYNIDSGRGNTHSYNCSISTKLKLSDIQKNHRTINRDGKQKVVNVEDLDIYLNDGWEVGRVDRDYSNQISKFKRTHYSKEYEQKLNSWKTNISNSIKGKKWVRNEFEEKQVNQDLVDYYLSLGYSLGRLFARGKNQKV